MKPRQPPSEQREGANSRNGLVPPVGDWLLMETDRR